MLSRCYNPKYKRAKQSYEGCTVCDEWLTFSNFKAWMETQDWEGKQLDKDLLVPGNKVYSPKTAVFVSSRINRFLIGHLTFKAAWYKRKKKYSASCGNPFTGRKEHLGYFDTPEAAHEAWRQRKHELACQYADMQTDSRVAEALRTRFSSKRSNP